MTRVLHADHVLPGDAPAIADGAVVVDARGGILDVGRAVDLLPRHAGAPVERVHGIVFPGLVNAHTHVELSAMHGRVPGGDGFVAWADRLVSARPGIGPDEEARGIAAAVEELVAAATVAVGDVSNALAAVRPLAAAGIVGSVFHEVFGSDRDTVLRRIEALAADAQARVPEWPRGLTYAPAPHTLFTLHVDGARALLDAAARRGARTSLHLAEHAAERSAVERGEGPAVEWLLRITGKPVAWPRRPLFDVAEDVGALRPAVLLVHLTDAEADELARVAMSGASVVFCPRSNLYIEERLPPVVLALDAGIEPALGTDSLASNTSLDVLAEARELAERFPGLRAWELVKMATWNGAVALGRRELGRLARGARPGVYCIEVRGATDDAAANLLGHIDAPRRRLAPHGGGEE